MGRAGHAGTGSNGHATEMPGLARRRRVSDWKSCSSSNSSSSSSNSSSSNNNSSNNNSSYRPTTRSPPCGVSSLPLEAQKAYIEEQKLLLRRDSLRENIRCVRKSTVDECSKLLDTIISYCECRANCKPETRPPRPPLCCQDNSRVGAGMSYGCCGGYTPSGWNRLMTLHSLECDDPCCPCCSCCCPPGTCTCCLTPCPDAKHKARRKRKACNITCNSQVTDENASAANTRPSAKILGELAFQLERRILDYVFGLEGSKRRRFYGYTVSNIHKMIDKESKTSKGDEDLARRAELELRLNNLLQGLKQTGYNLKVHGDFAQQMINRYGLLACPPDPHTVQEFGLQNPHCIAKLIPQLARGEHEAGHFQIVLRSLQHLSKLDSGPLFIW